jgi:hypothetical protein
MRRLFASQKNQRTESKATNSSYHSLQVQYLNNGSYGENLSSTTGPAEPIAQYFFKVFTPGRYSNVLSWQIPVSSSFIIRCIRITHTVHYRGQRDG